MSEGDEHLHDNEAPDEWPQPRQDASAVDGHQLHWRGEKREPLMHYFSSCHTGKI